MRQRQHTVDFSDCFSSRIYVWPTVCPRIKIFTCQLRQPSFELVCLADRTNIRTSSAFSGKSRWKILRISLGLEKSVFHKINGNFRVHTITRYTDVSLLNVFPLAEGFCWNCNAIFCSCIIKYCIFHVIYCQFQRKQSSFDKRRTRCFQIDVASTRVSIFDEWIAIISGSSESIIEKRSMVAWFRSKCRLDAARAIREISNRIYCHAAR